MNETISNHFMSTHTDFYGTHIGIFFHLIQVINYLLIAQKSMISIYANRGISHSLPLTNLHSQQRHAGECFSTGIFQRKERKKEPIFPDFLNKA